MSARSIVFLTDDLPWLRIEDEAIVARGRHFVAEDGDRDTMIVAIAPAQAVALHWLDLPGLAPAQARAAARLVAADKSLLAQADMFVACGDQADGDAARIIAIADRTHVSQWVEQIDPAVILPSPLLLVTCQDGFLRADLGHEVVLRGNDLGFAEDDIVTPLVVADAPVSKVDQPSLDAMLIAATRSPEINLRQGEFARKRNWSIDQRGLRWMIGVGAAIALISLIIPLAEIARLSWISATLEQTSASIAQTALGQAVAADAAAGALDTRLARLRGGGAGFVATAGAVIQAIEGTANSELSTMSFGPDGIMRVTVRATTPAELDAVQVRMHGAGLQITAGPLNPSQGKPVIDLQVRGQ